MLSFPRLAVSTSCCKLICVTSAMLVAATLMTATPLVIENAGLESPYNELGEQSRKAGATGEVASGWGVHAGCPAKFSRETAPETVHEGASAQRIDILKFTGRQTELTRRLALDKGTTYRATIWLRSDGLLPVQLSVREAAAPYKVAWSRKTTISPEWEAHEFTGKATAEDVFFVIALHAVGSVWIDSFHIASLDTATADDASVPTAATTNTNTTAASKNLLPASSFEAGLTAGWGVLIRSGDTLADYSRAEYRVTAPDTVATPEAPPAHAVRALRIPLDLGLATIVTSPLVAVQPDADYTASISLRTDGATADVRFSLIGDDGKDVRKATLRTIGADWQRLSLTAKAPPTGKLRLRINSAARVPLALHIDAAQLEAGSAATPYAAPHLFELAIRIPRPAAVVFDDETVPAEILLAPAQTATPLPPDARLRLEIETLATEPGALNPRLLLTDYPLTSILPDAAAVALPFTPPQPRGMFKLHATLVTASSEIPTLAEPAVKTFARLPRPTGLPADESFFGIHISLNPAAIAAARALGNKWVRLHDASGATKWFAVEPEENKFQFEDEGIDAARAAGLAILGMLDGAPPWASASPRATSGYFATYNLPDRADGDQLWTRYVSHVVSHYQGRIDHWEVWNEPWSSGFFKGTPTDYARLLNLASDAARAANPGASILGFNTAAHKGEWTREALAATRPGAFDIFSFHDYNPNFYGGAESNALRLARRFTEIQRPYLDPRLLWNTEGGPGHIASWYAAAPAKGLSPQAQVAHIVRFDVTQLSAGVRRSFYYTLHNPPPSGETGYSALEHDGSVRPVLAARAVLASLVDGAIWRERTEPAPGIEGHVFQRRDGGRITVLWRTSSHPAPFAVPAGSTLLDVFANPVSLQPAPVSSTPLYLLTPP